MLELFIWLGIILFVAVIVSICSVRFGKESSILTPGHIKGAQFSAQIAEEHQAGWRVFLNGECLGELDFAYEDPPTVIFRFIPHTKDAQQTKYALCSSGSREPDPCIEFENRASKVRVQDGPFCATLHENAIVALRDFRVPPITVSTKDIV